MSHAAVIPGSLSTAPLPVPRDFPDRMSPILVKELRQGMRQPAFVVSFLALQVLLGTVVLVAVLAMATGSGQNDEAGLTVSCFVFGLLGVVVLLVQPLRGLNAVAAEIRTDTLDLLLLTKLNAWRVVSGKWLALVSQSAVLVVAALPYLVLRYYLGGMNLLGELLALAALALLAIVFTAVLVGISACASLPARVLIGVAYTGSVLWCIGVSVLLLILMRQFGVPWGGILPGGAGITEVCQAVGVSVGALLFIGWYFLAMGATWIAPAAENRSTMKRLAGAGALALLLLVPAGIPWAREIAFVTVAGVLVLDALCERPGFTTSVVKRFDKLGFFAPVVRLWLLPGWPNGVFFAGAVGCVTLVLIWTGVLGWYPGLHPTIPVHVVLSLLWVAGFSAMLMPAVVRELLFRNKVEHPFAGYLYASLALHGIGGVVMAFAADTGSVDLLLGLVVLYPPTGLMVLEIYEMYEGATAPLLVAMTISLVHWLLLVMVGRAHWCSTLAASPTLTADVS